MKPESRPRPVSWDLVHVQRWMTGSWCRFIKRHSRLVSLLTAFLCRFNWIYLNNIYNTTLSHSVLLCLQQLSACLLSDCITSLTSLYFSNILILCSLLKSVTQRQTCSCFWLVGCYRPRLFPGNVLIAGLINPGLTYRADNLSGDLLAW